MKNCPWFGISICCLYTRIFETKMLPWEEDKILFTGLFIYDTDVGSFSGWSCQIKKQQWKTGFFAIYDVSCRQLNLNIVEIKDISCEDSTGQIKVIATSPFGNVNLFHNDESLAQGQTNIPVASPGIHKISAQDSFAPRLEGSLCTWPGERNFGETGYFTISQWDKSWNGVLFKHEYLQFVMYSSKWKIETWNTKILQLCHASLPYTIQPNGQFEFDIQV